MKCFLSFRFGGDLVAIGLRTYRNNVISSDLSIRNVLVRNTKPTGESTCTITIGIECETFKIFLPN